MEPAHIVPTEATAPVVQELTAPLVPTQRDELLLDMYRRVGRIEAHTENLVGIAGDHEDRIRGIEKRVWQVPGVSLILAVLGFFGIHHF